MVTTRSKSRIAYFCNRTSVLVIPFPPDTCNRSWFYSGPGSTTRLEITSHKLQVCVCMSRHQYFMRVCRGRSTQKISPPTRRPGTIPVVCVEVCACLSVCMYVCVCSGGSRISQMGAPTYEFEAKTYYLTGFLLNTVRLCV